MNGDEREEGKSDAPAGREATNLPENRMSHGVLVNAHRLFHVIFQKRARVFHRGFKHEKTFIVFECLTPR